jgi:hypothetical protein
MNLFIPITKVDEQRREVWGVAAEEAPDKSGELMDYELSKPRFEEWSKTISDATQGKSLGNVRAMHQPIAAGKVISMQFDDEAKKIFVGTKIVDDNEWKKVAEGVYTGFSVGGRYGSQKFENGLLRYEAIPLEVSIVDNPCMRGATFTMVKADGLTEERPFAKSDEPSADAPEEEDDEEKKKKKVEEADEGAGDEEAASDEMVKASYSVTLDGSTISTGTLDLSKASGASVYSTTPAGNMFLAVGPTPIADIYDKLHQHVDALGKAGARHSASDQKLIQAIHDSACALGGTCAGMDKLAAGDLQKDIDSESGWLAWSASMDVQDLASALSFVSGLASRMTSNSPDLGGKLSAAAQLITSALNDKVAEQAAATQAAAVDAAQDEAIEGQVEAATEAAADASTEASADTPAELAANATDGEEDMNKAQLDAFKAALVDDVKALLKEFTEGAAAPLQKAELASNDLAKRFDEVTARLGAFEGRVDKLEKMPAGSGPVLREVGAASANGDDAIIASLDQLIKDETDPTVRQALMAKRTQAAIKLSYRAGGNRMG